MANQDIIGRAFKLRTSNQNVIDLVEPFTLDIPAGNLLSAGASATRNVITTTASAVTLTAADSGNTYYCTASSGTQTFTLPAAASGLEFTFVCGHASGEILITPVTGDAIRTMAFAAIGADADTGAVAPAAGTGIKNTAATNVVGDNITLRCLDATTWQGISMPQGIWASQ